MIRRHSPPSLPATAADVPADGADAEPPKHVFARFPRKDVEKVLQEAFQELDDAFLEVVAVVVVGGGRWNSWRWSGGGASQAADPGRSLGPPFRDFRLPGLFLCVLSSPSLLILPFLAGQRMPGFLDITTAPTERAVLELFLRIDPWAPSPSFSAHGSCSLRVSACHVLDVDDGRGPPRPIST